MTTTRTRPRPTATETRADKRMSVEEMLREIAYVLHTTRRFTARDTARPARTPQAARAPRAAATA